MNTLRIATLGLGLLLPLMAGAQTSPDAASATEGAARRERASMTPEQRTQRVEAHLTELHGQLAITPAQQAPWEGFAKASRENAAEMHARFQQRETRFTRLNALENMTDYAEIGELHATQLRRLATAFAALYATLSPAQQHSVDLAFRTRRTPGAAPG